MTVNWPIVKFHWTCKHRWNGPRTRCGKCLRTGIHFLDETLPPVFSDEGVHTTLNTLSTMYSDTTRVPPAVRIALGLPDDAEIDADDPHLLMSAWEAYNYPRVATEMRQLGEVNPVLEQYSHSGREAK